MKYILGIIWSLLLFNCDEKQTKNLNANDLINQSIAASGGAILNDSMVVIEFDFRDIHYKSSYTPNSKVLMRLIVDQDDSIQDILKGEDFQRYVNGAPLKIEDSMKVKYAASVNAVHYFSVLPHGLNDAAVNKRYLNDIEINDKNYHKIEVTFSEDGGGEDFEDVFIYWVNAETYKVDYLAYSYNENDGKGLRFREAYNERYIKGIRFVDYNNYKPKEGKVNLEDLDILFIENKLEFLSKIELENVTVN